MASLLVSTSLDVVTGVAWWAIKTTSKGIYYGFSYMFYGPEPEKTEIEMGDLKLLTEEIKNLREEVKVLKTKNSEIEKTENKELSYEIIQHK